jgi:sugar phosphate isomerase/epimerase
LLLALSRQAEIDQGTAVRTYLKLLATVMMALSGAVGGANEFFAMDTIAKGPPETVVALLQETGFVGLGGTALDEAMPRALREKGLKFFNGYLVLQCDKPDAELASNLERWFALLEGTDAALWLAIDRVTTSGGTKVGPSDPTGDKRVVEQVRAIADIAARHGLRVSLYPHAGFWLERFADAVRVAKLCDRPNVGVTFNLCHWLKVEGAESDPLPLLRAALDRLQFVTINGADSGDTKNMDWGKLIQPLDAGTYDVARFVRELLALGYTGPVGFQGYGIKDPPRTVLVRTQQAWREMTGNQTLP